MIAGRGSADQLAARRFALQEPERLQELIDILVDASVAYLIGQIDAGADVVKIFDSWAGVLDDEGFERWALRPSARSWSKSGQRAERADHRLSARRRRAARRFRAPTGVDGVAVDWTLPMADAVGSCPAPTALQGNLDPLRLVVGGAALDEGIDRILAAMRGRPHIFNLGHGITPDTPVENVARLVERVRSSGR